MAFIKKQKTHSYPTVCLHEALYNNNNSNFRMVVFVLSWSCTELRLVCECYCYQRIRDLQYQDLESGRRLHFKLETSYAIIIEQNSFQ